LLDFELQSSNRAGLSPAALKKIKNDGENNAQEQGSGEREIERRVFAAINNVAWKAAKRKMSASEEKHYASG
jgi:hypothetical protein